MDKTVKIVGLTGKARSGKDSLAANIQQVVQESQFVDDLQNIIVATESFAAPIKGMIAMLLDFFAITELTNSAKVGEYVNGDKKEEVIERIGASPRKLMQTLGTDWGRNMINPEIWLNSMEERIKQYSEVALHGFKGVLVVITDVRFDNEAELIHKYGGKVYRIDRDIDEDVRDHASEAGVSGNLVDKVLSNNKDLENLYGLAEHVVEETYDINLNAEFEEFAENVN